MAIKKFIIKQTTNWNGKGEKVGTSTVQMDEANIAGYLALLDGKLEVFEQNMALSVEANTISSSFNVADFIKIRHSVHKPIYVSNANKRPLVFKTDLSNVISFIGGIKPFEAPYSADLPVDVSIDSGNMSLL